MRDFSLYSGERIPELQVDNIDLAHAARYQFAAEYLSRKNFRFGLDLFCGSGYGTQILAEKLNSTILGIDGSLDAIERAARLIGAPNALFSYKVFPFSVPEGWADFIVSFESLANIEHFEIFARAIAYGLAINGELLLSVPNEELLPKNKNGFLWQLRHFGTQEILDMFKPLGLISTQIFSLNAWIKNNGRAICRNNYSPVDAKVKSGNDGESIIYVFKKLAP